MKKVLSFILSVLMIASIMSAIDISAFAGSEITGIDFELADKYTIGLVTYDRYIRETLGNKLTVCRTDDTKTEYICMYKSGKKAFYSKNGDCIDMKDISFSSIRVQIGTNEITIGYKGFSIDTTFEAERISIKSITFSFASDVSIKENADKDYAPDIKNELYHKGNVLTFVDGDDITTVYTCVYNSDAKKNIYISAEGKEFIANDFNISGDYTNFKAGTNKLMVYPFGNIRYGCEASIKFNHSYSIKKATLSENGVKKCDGCGSVAETYYYPKTIKLSATELVYNGKVRKQTVIIKDANGKDISSSNYTATYSSGCKAPGKYKVTIKFKGNYSGTKTLYFVINPKATTLSKLTASKKGFTVKWKKQSTQTTGYQIQYSASSSFKSAKIVTVSNNTETSKKISSLKANKKYYVRVRTYKKVGSVDYCSAWSKTKTVTTK